MHYLHRILVTVNQDENREDKIDSARLTAESETEEFYGVVWDWRETETAGRWADEYPINVILASDNVDRFVDEMIDCRNSQIEFIKRMMCMAKETISLDIGNMDDAEVIEESYNKPYNVGFYGLKSALEILTGTYTSNSCFYDTENGDSKITPELIEQVRSSPKRYALVMFDYHN